MRIGLVTRVLAWMGVQRYREQIQEARAIRRKTIYRATMALRRRQYRLAQLLLEEWDDAHADPAALNILGLIAEHDHNAELALERWGKALHRDPGYEPALNNLKRVMKSI